MCVCVCLYAGVRRGGRQGGGERVVTEPLRESHHVVPRPQRRRKNHHHVSTTTAPCCSCSCLRHACPVNSATYTHTHTHPFNGPFSGTTQASRYQKGKTSLDYTEARDSEWQWHQRGRMQVSTSLQTDKHASSPPLRFFVSYRPDALPVAQPMASKH